MLDVVAAIFLFLLPLRVNGLITTDAKCLAGYEWTFSSIGQSPCDIAAELASVCAPGGQFNLEPLPPEFEYVGPTADNVNSCRCSSVYYSLLSACSYCQGRNYLGWSSYSTNCSTVYVTIYNQQIPAGVKVPAYAYQNVSISDSFDLSLAQHTTGAESSGAPPPTTITSSSSSYVPPTGNSHNNTPAIVGGVVGGIVGLVALGLLFTVIFLKFRSKRRKRTQKDNSGVEKSPKMAFTPNTMTPLTLSPGPGSPGKVYDPNDPSTYPSTDPNVYYPYRQHSPPISHNTGGSVPPQQTTQNTGPPQYGGVPEL